MDRVTLEHYEQRAMQGRELVKKIEDLKLMKYQIEKGRLIRIYTKSSSFNKEYDFSKYVDDQVSDDRFKAAAETRMLEILFEEIDRETELLEKELREL